MSRYANLGKRDANEKAIAAALRKVGCDVVSGTDVDLYIRPNPKHQDALLMEIKVPGKESNLTALQTRLKAIFGSQYVVVSSVESALKAVGIANI